MHARRVSRVSRITGKVPKTNCLQSPVVFGTTLPVMSTTPLYKIRKKRGVSLGKLANATGLDKGNLSKLERGEVGTSPESAAKIASFFGRDWITELHILYPERYQDYEHS